MWITTLLLGGVAAAGLHAHNNNKNAKSLVSEAKSLYHTSQSKLERSQENATEALRTLGEHRKIVAATYFQKFLTAYTRIKHAKLKDSEEIKDLEKFFLSQRDIQELMDMKTNCEMKSNSPLAIGGLGLLVCTASPLTFVAAPALVISSALKSGENLEIAEEFYEKTKLDVEKMETSVLICDAITKHAEMLDCLLIELVPIFERCCSMLDSFTTQKMKELQTDFIPAECLTKEELALAAITRALMGTIKTIVATPVLKENGDINEQSQTCYDSVSGQLPGLKEQAAAAAAETYSVPVRVPALRKAFEPPVTTFLPNIPFSKRLIGTVIAYFVATFLYSNIDTYGSYPALKFFLLSATILPALRFSPRSMMFRMQPFLLSLLATLTFYQYNLGGFILPLTWLVGGILILLFLASEEPEKHPIRLALSNLGAGLLAFSASGVLELLAFILFLFPEFIQTAVVILVFFLCINALFDSIYNKK